MRNIRIHLIAPLGVPFALAVACGTSSSPGITVMDNSGPDSSIGTDSGEDATTRGRSGGSTSSSGGGDAGDADNGDGHGGASSSTTGVGDGGGKAGDLYNVVVPGTADIWLAGQPNGTIVSGGWPMNDVAPADSPVEVPVMTGSTLTILATGATSNNRSPCAGATPDGCGDDHDAGPDNGLGSLTSPENALIGVFLNDTISSETPPGLVMLAANDFATLSPLLQQVFFIGDGMTGTGNGAVQFFIAPPTATRLFLASSDALGANYNNSGEFMVTVSPLPAGAGTSDADVFDADASDDGTSEASSIPDGASD
jgi:hypothetical protein